MSKTKIMQRFSLLIVVTAIAFGADPTASEYGSKSAFLVQVGTIPLKGVEGRLDHFGFDARRKRLFLAALGNDTVELVDLRLGKVIQQIKNLRAPQGIGVASKADRLAVANDQDGSVRLYDVNSLQQTAAIELKE